MMSYSSSTDPGEISISARRTESLDAPEILKLVTSNTYTLFGKVNVVHIIEKANLAVTLVDDTNTVVGHVSFYDHPNWSASPTSHWMQWLQEHFQAQEFDPINSLFLHYYVSKEEFSEGILKEMIRTVFHAVPLLHFLVLVAPVAVDIGESLSNLFQPIERSFNYNTEFQTYVCHRHDHCPVLHIREARIEDHDDLMPIFDKHNHHLIEIYGDFFLSELIEAQDEQNKCIVADVDGTAVGFMSVSTKVNTGILKRNFELDVFNYFLKKVERTRKVLAEENEDRVNTTTPEGEHEDRNSSVSSQLSASSSREGSPLKSPQSSTKLSSAHLHDCSASSNETKKSQKSSTITEVFDTESVFCIQLFCMDERYEARSVDFLPFAFDLFKEKDFIIITVPHTVPEFPLLQTFQRVSPKASSTLPQELYLFNRYGLLRSMKIRCCTSNDLNSIINLTESIQGHADLLRDINRYNDYRRDEDGVRIYAYVAEVNEQAVGVCVLRHEKEIDYIRSHYNIEDFVYFRLHEANEHLHLHHFVLNPIFQHYSKYFIKEVLYLSHTSCIFYPMYPEHSKQKVTKPHSLVTCLSDLVPVSLRRQILYDTEKLAENSPIEDTLAEKEPYALYHINRKLTLEPKVVINIRIVVVGDSETGLSALQTLAFCPHLYFNNLTLVSETDVFDCLTSYDKFKDSFIPKSLDYNSRQQALLSLKTWTNIVQGKLTRIDRKNKYLTVSGNNKVPYDLLLLCTGKQYHTTVPTGADVQQLLTTSEALQANIPQVHHGFTPNNVFTINGLADCLNVRGWLEESFKAEKVIVYGSALEAYTCINGLLTHGVDGSCITHVHPPSTPPSCFNEFHIDDTIRKELEAAGVRSYYNYTLARWNNGEEDPVLKIASFTSDTKPMTLECQVFFCYHSKTIDYQAFKAINDCCLVFDGKLVINTKFNTNDDSIRAAGPLTKYARRYYSENWTHSNFNPKEIGGVLAETILELFDPTLESTDRQEDGSIPQYKDAKYVFCQLPGGYNYFRVWKPCIDIPLESLRTQPDYGQDIVTGSALRKDEPEYFRIHLNKYNTVQDITCLSKKPIDASNYLCLYGMHERYLNNMLQRYKEGLIKDLYSYFSEAWCLPIYHDRFKDFRKEIREILSTVEDGRNPSLEEKVRSMVQEDEELGIEQKRHILDIFVGSGSKKTIEERFNCFLDYNRYHLPMFARPTML